jgi:membrane protein DedA with SNARE-associated domain
MNGGFLDEYHRSTVSRARALWSACTLRCDFRCLCRVPLPVSFLLVAAGSFAKQGEMKLLPVIIAASSAAILGDQIGYGLSRWGGRRLVDRITTE